MALIKRLNIIEFKVVSFPSEPGIQEEYTGNSWQLNEPIPNQQIIGTEDFFGTTRTSVLLAKLESLNVRTVLTAQEFRQVPPGQLNGFDPNYEFFTEQIGWIELGRSVNSIYYEDCSKIVNDANLGKLNIPGRLPVSRDYFDFDFLQIPLEGNGNISIVSGEGFGAAAVQIVQVLNVYNNLGQGDLVSFGPDPTVYPALPLYGPNEYLPLVMTFNGQSNVPGPAGGFQDVVTFKTNERQVDLLLTTRYDIEEPSSPNYMGNDSDISPFPNSIPYDDGRKLRWGSSRRVVQRGFSTTITQTQGFGNEPMWETTLNNRSEGICIEYLDRATTTEETGLDGGGDIIDDGGGIYPDLTMDPPPTEDLPFCEGCPPFYKIPINFPPIDVIQQNEREGNYMSFTGTTKTLDSNVNIPGYVQNPIEDNSLILRTFEQGLSVIANIRDPRELGLDIKSNPAGYFHVLFNKKTCSFDVFPALRDKDGDIPEPIGPTVAYYMEDIRRQISQRFYLPQEDSVLKTLSTGSDGYLRFSDGKSYKELLGESVLGCGDYFSFDKIPEVFVELYPVNERQEIKDYRRIVERPTALPVFVASDRTHDQNYISDIVKDLTVGIPDLDMATQIDRPDRPSMISMNDVTFAGRWIFFPSRWKSMVRPIIDSIIENRSDIVDPRWTNMVENRGQFQFVPIDTPSWKDGAVLGDYELRRKKFGEGKIIYDILDDAISDRIYFGQEETKTRKSNSIFDYLTFGHIYHHFSDSLSTPIRDWRIENVVNLLNNGKKIYKILKHPESLINFAAKDVVIFLLTQIYSAISYDYNRTNPERNSLSPLRTFKKGGVILQSKTGYYFHDKEPCPVLFLGFNDGKKIRTDIQNLTKNDEEDTFYFKSSNRYFANSARPKMIHFMPGMKKRVKQYGINPLLDIFYLNIAEKSKENPGISPFRPGPSSEMMGGKANWPDFSKGQYPYMFPPMWNEPSNAPNTPSMDDLGLRDGAQWGDLAWRKRKSNAIIPLKDRWSLSIDKDIDGVPYVVLTDKTPILDIYNMLMEMHVKGVSWKEIQVYINRTKSAVYGSRYNEKINLDTLEGISRELQVKLNSKDIEILSEIYEEDLPSISIQPINWGILEFDEKRNEVLIADVVFKSPNTNRRIYINQVFIESDEINGTRDTYDTLSSDLFEIGLVGSGFNYAQSESQILPLADSVNRNTPLSPNELYKFSVKFKNGTSELSVQPMFQYSANVIISYSLDSPDGEQFESSTTLTAMVSTDRKITRTEEPYYFEPIITQNVIEFDFVEESNTITQTVLLNNYSDTDSVKIVSATLDEMIIYINVNGNITPITSKLFDSGKSDAFFEIKNFSATEIAPTKINEPVIPYEIIISFKPDTDTSYSLKSGDGVYYYAKMFINYEHGNVGKTIRTNKSIEIPISGYTVKT
jgi:hypothetical protein